MLSKNTLLTFMIDKLLLDLLRMQANLFIRMRLQNLNKELKKNDIRNYKHKLKEYRESHRLQLDVICYLMIILSFTQDNSIILLLLRTFHQFTLGHSPDSVRDKEIFKSWSGGRRKLLVLRISMISIIVWLVTLVYHIFFYNSDSNHIIKGNNLINQFGSLNLENGHWNNEFQYGGWLINIFGEHKFKSLFAKIFCLFFLDSIIFSIQTLEFVENYIVGFGLVNAIMSEDSFGEANGDEFEVENSDGSSDPNNISNRSEIKNYDGCQGNILIYRIKPLEIFQMLKSFTKEDIMAEYLRETRFENENNLSDIV